MLDALKISQWRSRNEFIVFIVLLYKFAQLLLQAKSCLRVH